jgi:hypothetical protein
MYGTVASNRVEATMETPVDGGKMYCSLVMQVFLTTLIMNPPVWVSKDAVSEPIWIARIASGLNARINTTGLCSSWMLQMVMWV